MRACRCIPFDIGKLRESAVPTGKFAIDKKRSGRTLQYSYMQRSWLTSRVITGNCVGLDMLCQLGSGR